MGSPHWCVTYTVKHEPLNEKDGNAVAVVRPLLSNFFFYHVQRGCDCQQHTITSASVCYQISEAKENNRLEMPCCYIFSRDNDTFIPLFR